MGPGLSPLGDATDEAAFGGKAVSLGAAIRAGLPVPHGVAIPAALVEQVARGDTGALAAILESGLVPAGRLAVRSSAVGEDSSASSFAGQHLTRLNATASTLEDAVRAVWESGHSDAALGYRARRGITDAPAIGVVVQALIEPVAAGVLFTRHPITGADERLIEAAWGLGEAVVSGRVVPDSYRLAPDGRVLESTAGHKDVKVWFGDGDGTIELPVDDDLQRVLCLTAAHLGQLHALAERCRAVWNRELDLEWALSPAGSMHLLQSRPITTADGG